MWVWHHGVVPGWYYHAGGSHGLSHGCRLGLEGRRQGGDIGLGLGTKLIHLLNVFQYFSLGPTYPLLVDGPGPASLVVVIPHITLSRFIHREPPLEVHPGRVLGGAGRRGCGR